jgi:glutamate racemase
LPEKYIDTLLIFLACTHYGYRQDLFQKAFNEEGFSNITLLNPNLASAENLVKTFSNNLNYISTESKAFSVEFVTPYAIPDQEIITLTQLLSPISPATADALKNAKICPELLNP